MIAGTDDLLGDTWGKEEVQAQLGTGRGKGLFRAESCEEADAIERDSHHLILKSRDLADCLHVDLRQQIQRFPRSDPNATIFGFFPSKILGSMHHISDQEAQDQESGIGRSRSPKTSVEVSHAAVRILLDYRDRLACSRIRSIKGPAYGNGARGGR